MGSNSRAQPGQARQRENGMGLVNSRQATVPSSVPSPLRQERKARLRHVRWMRVVGWIKEKLYPLRPALTMPETIQCPDKWLPYTTSPTVRQGEKTAMISASWLLSPCGGAGCVDDLTCARKLCHISMSYQHREEKLFPAAKHLSAAVPPTRVIWHGAGP